MDKKQNKLMYLLNKMCDEYCKYPLSYNPYEHDGEELSENIICKNCPLNEIKEIKNGK